MARPEASRDVVGEMAAIAAAARDLGDAASAERQARVRLEAAMVRASQAGASQRRIAVSAGCSQPYVSQVVGRSIGRFVPRSALGYRLVAHRSEVLAAARRAGLDRVRVFGSVARGEDGPTSDIDLAADIPESMGLIGLAKVENEIAAIVGADVEIAPAGLFRPEVFETARRDLVAL